MFSLYIYLGINDWKWVVCLHMHPHAGDTMNEKSE